jgi:hypothetical protein
MKNIKTYEAYNNEEFVTGVITSLKQYNLTPMYINQIIISYADKIDKYYNDGKQPFQFVNDMKDELELSKGGYPSVGFPKGNTSQLNKYL